MEEKFENYNDSVVDDFISYFGYGNCHDLSLTIAEEFGLDIGIIRSQPSGMPVHSIIFLSDKLTFDAHGIEDINTKVDRYSHFAHDFEEDEVDLERMNIKEGINHLQGLSCMGDEEKEFTLSELSILDERTGFRAKIQRVIEKEQEVDNKLSEWIEKRQVDSKEIPEKISKKKTLKP